MSVRAALLGDPRVHLAAIAAAIACLSPQGLPEPTPPSPFEDAHVLYVEEDLDPRVPMPPAAVPPARNAVVHGADLAP